MTDACETCYHVLSEIGGNHTLFPIKWVNTTAAPVRGHHPRIMKRNFLIRADAGGGSPNTSSSVRKPPFALVAASASYPGPSACRGDRRNRPPATPPKRQLHS